MNSNLINLMNSNLINLMNSNLIKLMNSNLINLMNSTIVFTIEWGDLAHTITPRETNTPHSIIVTTKYCIVNFWQIKSDKNSLIMTYNRRKLCSNFVIFYWWITLVYDRESCYLGKTGKANFYQFANFR